MTNSKKYLKISLNILTALTLCAACIWILPKVISFFMPFIVAGIVALIANPIVKFLEKKMKIKRKAGTVVVIVLVLAIIVFILYAIIAKLIQELTGFVGVAPQIWKNMVVAIQSIDVNGSSRLFKRMSPDFGITMDRIYDSIGEAIAMGLQNLISNITSPQEEGGFVSSVPNAIISIIMTILASYMFVADDDFFSNMYKKFVPEGVSSRVKIVVDSMKSAVGGYFSAQLKIMAVVYIVLLAGFLMLRVEYAALVAFLIALLDFLPFFGTGTVMIPWAIIAIIQSDYKFAAGIFIIWALSQITRQIIQPKLLSDSMGLPPIPTLFLLYIGFKCAGALGLIFAAPVGMIIYNLYKAGVFSNFIYSIKILIKDFSKARKFTDEELKKEGIK